MIPQVVVFRVVTWIITVIIGAVRALCPRCAKTPPWGAVPIMTAGVCARLLCLQELLMLHLARTSRRVLGRRTFHATALRAASRQTPHGGVLLDQMVKDPKEKEDLIAQCEGRVKQLNDRQCCDTELIINGGFSPLSGFMNPGTGSHPRWGRAREGPEGMATQGSGTRALPPSLPLVPPDSHRPSLDSGCSCKSPSETFGLPADVWHCRLSDLHPIFWLALLCHTTHPPPPHPAYTCMGSWGMLEDFRL